MLICLRIGTRWVIIDHHARFVRRHEVTGDDEDRIVFMQIAQLRGAAARTVVVVNVHNTGNIIGLKGVGAESAADRDDS